MNEKLYRCHAENFDISIPFALYVGAHLQAGAKKARTDADKLALVCQGLTAYLVMSAGQYLSPGITILTDFFTQTFWPFVEQGKQAGSDEPWLWKFPITDSISAECHLVPGGHFDLFITDETDVLELSRQLEEQGLIEPDEGEVEVCNE